MEKSKLDALREKLIAEREKHKAEAPRIRKEYFENLKPFKSVDDIPDVPRVSAEEYESVIVPNLIRCGAIPKSELEVGATYKGSCRNSSEATWTGTEFKYRRYKWGSYYTDTINHFQDDDGYDVFVPIEKIKDVDSSVSEA